MDYVLVNTKKPSTKLIKQYEKNRQYFVKDTTQGMQKPVIIRDNFIHDTAWKQEGADPVRREIIRHEYETVAKHIKKILQ